MPGQQFLLIGFLASIDALEITQDDILQALVTCECIDRLARHGCLTDKLQAIRAVYAGRAEADRPLIFPFGPAAGRSVPPAGSSGREASPRRAGPPANSPALRPHARATPSAALVGSAKTDRPPNRPPTGQRTPPQSFPTIFLSSGRVFPFSPCEPGRPRHGREFPA